MSKTSRRPRADKLQGLSLEPTVNESLIGATFWGNNGVMLSSPSLDNQPNPARSADQELVTDYRIARIMVKGSYQWQLILLTEDCTTYAGLLIPNCDCGLCAWVSWNAPAWACKPC